MWEEKWLFSVNFIQQEEKGCLLSLYFVSYLQAANHIWSRSTCNSRLLRTRSKNLRCRGRVPSTGTGRWVSYREGKTAP